MTICMTPKGDRSVWLLPVTCLASFLVVLDAMIVSVALPAIAADLRMNATTAPWVVNAYTLLFAGTLLLGGRCVDVLGRWRVLTVGAALFTVSSLACGLVGSATALLVCRAVQGVGSAAMLPATLAVLIAAHAGARERARALGTWSAVAALGAGAGPILGGLLTSLWGWRWIFFISVPLGTLVVIGAVVLAEPTPHTGPRARLDVVGAVLATAGLVGVVFAVMRSPQTGWSDPAVLVTTGTGAVLLVVFVLHETRWAPQPLMPVELFQARSVAAANAVMLLVGLAFVPSLLMLSFVMQYSYGYSPLRAGLGFAPVGAAMTIGARLAGHLVPTIGARLTTAACCAVGATGLLWAAVAVGLQQPYVIAMAIPGFLFGLGTAGAFTPLTVSATSDIAPGRQGAAGGLLNTVRQTSGAVGIAVFGYVSITVAGTESTAATTALALGYAAALGLGAGLLIVAAVTAFAAMPRAGIPRANR
ncbi:DHA2 family efflux MFS transporter permease subunit [Streptomyces decoyicus]